MDRRALLQCLAGATIAALGRPSLSLAAGDPGAKVNVNAGAVGKFAATSAALTGFSSATPEDLGRMLRAFVTPARRAGLLRLEALVAATTAGELDGALRTSGLQSLADDLVAAWYSGVVKQGKKSQLVLYADAYVWAAMTFTKPMGVCGGITGYWANPPG